MKRGFVILMPQSGTELNSWTGSTTRIRTCLAALRKLLLCIDFNGNAWTKIFDCFLAITFLFGSGYFASRGKIAPCYFAIWRQNSPHGYFAASAKIALSLMLTLTLTHTLTLILTLIPTLALTLTQTLTQTEQKHYRYNTYRILALEAK